MLIIGILLGPIPYANYVGGILALVGAIMVIPGRQTFGQRYSGFVIAALVIYFVGFAIFIVNAVGLVFSLVSVGLRTPTSAGQIVSNAFNQILIGVISRPPMYHVASLLFHGM